MPVFARFIRSDAMVERGGEESDYLLQNAEGYQLTYDMLRSLPEGETVAHYDSEVDAWVLVDGPRKGVMFSDVVIAIIR